MLRPLALAALALSAVRASASPVKAREFVGLLHGRFDPGTIVIRTGERKLYYGTAPGEAIRYTVAVGKAGKQWRGVKYVEELQVDPAWSPPAEVRRDNPRLPDVIPGGSPRNPMGARVIGLGPTGQYAIHGTNMPNTIGTAASYGCFRMHNQDAVSYTHLDVYKRQPSMSTAGA